MNEELIKAAEYIDEHGWTQGSYEDVYTGQVCMMGAVLRVSTAPLLQEIAITHLGKFIKHNYKIPTIAIANDRVCKTAGEACKILREAAEWDQNELV